MSRERFQDELADLRAEVLDLGDVVVTQLDAGLDALEAGDPEKARAVIDGDAAINRRYLELEGDCIDLFALQQPVASDLRFVASSFKILTDLERIGDLATNFGQYALAESRAPRPDVDVINIGRDARAMVEDALAAYADGDLGMCYRIEDRDDGIDTLCQHASEGIVRDLIGREAETIDSWSLERLLDDVSRLLLTIRDVERVGDHAVNIAARTLYMVEQDSELLY